MKLLAVCFLFLVAGSLCEALFLKEVGDYIKTKLKNPHKKVGHIVKSLVTKPRENDEWVGDTKPWFCHNLDCPKYKVVKKFKSNGIDIEERCYGQTEWVSTSSVVPHKEKSSFKGMFRRLFKYISGDNERKEKVEMTAPVLVQIKMDDKLADKLDLTMNFFVPPEKTATLPKPSATNVKISNLPPTCVYVRSYGGWQMGINNKMHEKVEELRSALKSYGLGGQYNEESMMFAGYDSPWRLMNRHNEVMVTKMNKKPKVNKV